MRVAAFGRARMLHDAIVAVRAAGHDIVLIGTCPAAPEYDVTERDFQSLARKIGCPFFNDSRIGRPEHVRRIERAGAKVAISWNWLTLIPGDVIARFRHGIINAHVGDLPRYRGNACPNWAILNGEQEVVLTLHQMDDGLDSGPVLLKRRFPLADDSYISDVYRFLDYAVPEAFAEVLSRLASGKLRPKAQRADPSASLRCFPRYPSDGLIAWSEPALQIVRLVRASGRPFAGAYTHLERARLVVHRAHAVKLPYPYSGKPGQVVAVDKTRGEATVLCGKGAVVVEEVNYNGRDGRAADFIRSTRVRLGLDLAGEVERQREELVELRRKLEGRAT